MMSKTAVQKRPITVPVSGGFDVLSGGLGPKPKPNYVPWGVYTVHRGP